MRRITDPDQCPRGANASGRQPTPCKPNRQVLTLFPGLIPVSTLRAEGLDPNYCVQSGKILGADVIMGSSHE